MINRHTGFLSVSQLAKSMNYSSQAIRKAIRENRIDAYVVGNQYVIKCEDAEKFIKEKRKR